MNFKIFCCSALMLGASLTCLSAYTFTLTDGTTLNGKFKGWENKKVVIKKSDGKTARLTFREFSKKDQTYILKTHKKMQDEKRAKYKASQKQKVQPVLKPRPAVERDPAKSVTETPLSEIQKVSKKIDQLLQQGYKEHGVKPLPKANDETFLRRAYLDIAGRIPSHGEAQKFFNDPAKDKREVLIDTLLDSKAYDSHTYIWWADLLRLKDRFPGAAGQYGGPGAYVKWVKDAIHANIPYNQFVRELLTPEGYSWQNGAVGYYMRDSGMPLDNMSNTVQVFLGTQMVCAQCHNHPFDKWTQMEYYQLAAYTYGIHTRVNSAVRTKAQTEMRKEYMESLEKKGIERNTPEAKKAEQDMRRSYGRATSEIFKPLAYGVQDYHNRHLSLPHDYQYADAKPKSRVEASTLFGKEIDVSKFETSKDAYADWMTSAENPRFTKVIANRLWKRAMGRGLIEPVDDIRDDTTASNPALMDYLEKQLVSLGYDMKQFLRAIYNTDAYQRESYTGELMVVDNFPFQGPVLNRLSAEQIWDSLVTLALPDPDNRVASFEKSETRLEAYSKYEKILNSKEPKEVVTMIKEGAKMEQEYNGKLRELQEQIAEAQKAEDLEKIRDLRREYGKIRRSMESNYMLLATGGEDIMGGGKSMGMTFYNRMEPDMQNSTYKGFSRNIIRASELPNPAPQGHFLRQFGQSDRELIENASAEATIPQVLTLLNGQQFYSMLSKRSPLGQAVQAAETNEGKVQAIYLSILNRQPDADEMEACLSLAVGHPNNLTKVNLTPDQKRKRQKANKGLYLTAPWSDIIWAVLNTQEFLFRL